MRIDSHQHFWQFDPVRDSWIDSSMEKIAKDFEHKDLKPLLEQSKIDGCVAVQADQSETENEFLLKLAEHNPFVKGVVGWVDLSSNDLSERLTDQEMVSAFHSTTDFETRSAVGLIRDWESPRLLQHRSQIANLASLFRPTHAGFGGDLELRFRYDQTGCRLHCSR